jgi:hypothetical protein
VLSQNRYGSAATRRTLRIGQGAVKETLVKIFCGGASRHVSPGR